ncbi:RTX toxins and related Ca2+-binding protein [Roseobacter sp. AzwK-3b]|uniref:Ig-like domain-containing protein n=1 Tax=Roseobacter sp. AzwK-3b TaxID=351016 RepID=UPI00015695AC|nr:Ig-like domain-containing protein [Roseobacter sp. AzwK-3b]EDM72350.1 RTX toxins and related Ca2+-binding protein [Roseobacter sp. AzwK-3b]
MTFFDPKTAVIGGRVFSDSNADNTEFSASGGFEAGLDGQLVQLLDAHGNVIKATHTDHYGFYSFTHLASGDYFVQFPNQVDDLTLAEKDIGGFRADSDANVDTGRTDPIHVQPGESKTEVDAGYSLKPQQDGTVDGAETGEFMPVGYADTQGEVVTEGNDRIFGNGGDDDIRSGGGDDFIDGGTGNDNIFGGTGNDFVLAGDGDDTVRGREGDDYIDAGAGNDNIMGEDGDDVLRGRAGDDFVAGGSGNDDILGEDGNDSLYGDTGDDFIGGGAGDDIISDALEGFVGGGNDQFYGDDGNDTLLGGDGHDTLVGGADADRIEGGAGDDLITFDNPFVDNEDPTTDGAGDMIFGGAEGALDNDTLDLRGAGPVTIDQQIDENDEGATKGTVTFADGSTLTFEGIETILSDGDGTVDGAETGEFMPVGYADTQGDVVTEGNDRIFGNGGDDDIRSGGGDDFIDGGTGNDNIFGGTGNDFVLAGDGDDTVRGREGDDYIDAGAGNDNIMGEDGDDVLRGRAGDDFVAGGSGNDDILGEDGNDSLYGDTGDDFIGGGAGDDIISDALEGFVGGGNDQFYGDDGNDTLLGGDGHDTLVGGADADRIEGGAGDDLITFDNPFVDNEDPTTDGAGDMIFGGAEGALDNDTLDLRGAGPVTIDQQIDENDEGATKGTVTFADGGTLTFEGIETILSDGEANAAPVAVDDAAVVLEDGSVTIDVLSNDVDPEEDPLTVTQASAENGTVTVNDDNSLEYTPDPGFFGTDIITYEISDGFGNTDTGEVTVEVEEVPDAPVVDGTAGDDVLLSDFVDEDGDQIDGTDGLNDTIDAGPGNDFVDGGAGDDTFLDNAGNDVYFGNEGNDTYVAQDTGNVFVTVSQEGNGQVQNVPSGEVDEVFSVESFVAGEDESGFDGIAFDEAIPEDEIATQLQGISDNAFGQFFPDAAPPVAFGPEVGLLLSDVLGGAVGGSPVGGYLIEGGDEDGQIGEISFENFEQIFFGVEMASDRETEERAFEEMRMREDLREEEEELDRMGMTM